MRALVVTNMYPAPGDPARGIFVRDQVDELRRLPGLEVELYAFRSEGIPAYARAARALRRRYGRSPGFDIVHAHFGLTLWPGLAVRGAPHAVTLHGTDLVHPRSRAITLAGLPFCELVAPVSERLRTLLPERARGRAVVLPTGVSTRRFAPIERGEARRALGLDPAGPYLLFAAARDRPEKRHDRALEVAGDVPLLALEGVAPDEVPLWVNAANAVLVTSDRESFGLAALEALACDVPVLSTPVGVAPEALHGVQGTLCAPFDPDTWRAALAPLLADPDPRVAGRAAAERWSAARMAARVRDAWEAVAGG